MRKVNKMLTALLLCGVTTTSHAVKIEVMPTVGKAFKTSQDRMEDDEILYGVRGTVFLNDEVGLQASFEGSTGNKVGTASQKASGSETDIERVSANIVYEKNTGKRIRPYIIVGTGLEATHGSVAPAGRDGSQGFIQAGGGLKFGINKRVDLVTEAKWIRKLSNNDDDIVATVGLGINSGHINTKPNIPSVLETSEVQNAINLAEFKKLAAQKKAAPIAIPVEESISTGLEVVEEGIPADAIILTDDATTQPLEVVEEGDYIETPSSVASYDEGTQDGFYIQMAALFEGTGQALTSRLESKDYPYVLHNVEKRGREATLVLVGPYETQQEASVAMRYLKRLKSDAFVYHMN